MTTTVNFLDKDHTEASVGQMDMPALLELRNLVAANLGVQAVKEFKDQSTAVAQTWKALVKYESEMGSADEAKPAKPVKPVKAPKEPRGLAKPAATQYVKRPTRKMFAIVSIVQQHTGAEGRADRWPNYKDGMMVIDAIEGEGTLAWDIGNWSAQGLMTVTEPTDAEYEERRAAWYKKHNREDPDAEKIRKTTEREAAKAERAEAAATKKLEREAEKAAKAEAAAKAKAEAAAKATAAE